MSDRIRRTPEEWRARLSDQQYRVTREGHTEAPFTGAYNHEKREGMYTCVCCGAPLFRSDEKYDSGSGWPSFYAPADGENVETREDTSHGMRRTEVVCASCDAHLGHLFPDGPRPTGMRYCINSCALSLEPKEEGGE